MNHASLDISETSEQASMATEVQMYGVEGGVTHARRGGIQSRRANCVFEVKA